MTCWFFPGNLDGVIQTVEQFSSGKLCTESPGEASNRPKKKGGKKIDGWGIRFRDLASHPQVFCKLSGYWVD